MPDFSRSYIVKIKKGYKSMFEEITRLTKEGFLSLPDEVLIGFKNRKVAGVILYIEGNQIVLKPVSSRKKKKMPV